MIRANLSQYTRHGLQSQPSYEGSRASNQRFKYLQQPQYSIARKYQQFGVSNVSAYEKQNNIRDTNLNLNAHRYSPSINETDQRHVKSTSSTNQQTHPKTSTDNLHALKLESQILELQKTLDQQQYQIQTLTLQASHFMKICEEQKQILIGLNIEGMRSEYQEQIEELLTQRQKVQEIITQLQDDYNQVYSKEENQLILMRHRNDELSKLIQEQLQRKKAMLSLLSNKDKEFMEIQIDYRENQERLDQLRNIERKLTIAIRQLERLRAKQLEHNSKNKGSNKQLFKVQQEPKQFVITKSQQREAKSRSQDKLKDLLFQSASKRSLQKPNDQRRSSGKKYKYQYYQHQ